MNRTLRFCACLCVGWTLVFHCAVASVRAQDLSRRTFAVHFEQGVAHVSARARDIADADLLRRLQSGLPQTLVTRVYAYAGEDEAPIAVGARACRIVYDPWRMSYRVQTTLAGTERTRAFTRADEVLGECLDLDELPVGRRGEFDRVRGRAIWFAAIVELNPISPDMVQRIQRWLTQPSGVPGNEAFFGSFVSLFVNRRIAEAARVLRFRSREDVRCP